VPGIHHVTAIAGDPQRNLDFYAGVLGLRLVKRTVNFDDPHTYHFYFGDEVGSPGSLLTFFPWPGARRGRVGAGQVAVTSFAVVPEAIGSWVGRLVRHGVEFEGPTTRRLAGDVESVLAFRDPDGLMLEIVGDAGAAARRAWEGAPGIAAAHALRGIHSVTLWVASHDESERLLTETLGFRDAGEAETTRRFVPVAAGATGRVDVRAVGGFPRGAEGAGTVHHVAFRVADEPAQIALRDQVLATGRRPTPVIDRQYFRSVYFREPGGVLYELATDGPGFATDEPAEHLGERLMLPPRYESARETIESSLPAIHLPGGGSARAAAGAGPGAPDAGRVAAHGADAAAELGFTHRYLPPASPGAAGRVTLLLLHGTGGDENDLLPLGRMLLPGAGLLSPRGKVLENGMPRYFRRIAEGVFDQEDLALRTTELAEFIRAATAAYRLDPAGIVAVGFSNGANIAASLLLREPGLLPAAMLLSPMMPFEPGAPPALGGTAVFIGAGRSDALVPPAQVERLAQVLGEGGASVTVRWDPDGHGIPPGVVTAAREWIGAWWAGRVGPRTGAPAP
jgi:predicted esterase/catechol 2,3-dioxygenase-like lactoylglutathione lyase family enzyme